MKTQAKQTRDVQCQVKHPLAVKIARGPLLWSSVFTGVITFAVFTAQWAFRDTICWDEAHDSGPWADNNFGCKHHQKNPLLKEGVQWYAPQNKCVVNHSPCFMHTCKFGKGQPGFMREPSNAASALAFLWVSFYILLLGLGDSRKFRPSGSMPVGVSIIFAITNFIHFLGCFLNHSSRMWVFHVGDVFGMQIIVWATFIYSLVRRFKLHPPSRLTAILLIVVSPTIIMASLSAYDDPCCEQKEFVLMGTLFIALVCVNWSERDRIKPALLALALGMGFQAGDKAERQWINPGWYIHGHAIWHIVTAIAMCLMYQSLRDPPSSGKYFKTRIRKGIYHGRESIQVPVGRERSKSELLPLTL